MHRRHVHDLLGADKAVAGVGQKRLRIDRQAGKLGDQRCGDHFPVGVGHVPGFRHQRRDLNRVADDMDVFRRGRFESQVIDIAPACVGVGQTRLHRDGASPHARQHVQHVGLDVALHVELDGAGFCIDGGGLVLWPVLDHSGVVLGPVFFEQRAFRCHVLIGIEDQHLGFRLGLLEVARHLTGALVGAGRAAVRCFGNRQRIDAAVGHRFELLAQREGFSAALPGLKDLT